MRFSALTAAAALVGSAAAAAIGSSVGGILGGVEKTCNDLAITPASIPGSGGIVAGAQVVIQIQVLGNINASLIQPAQQLSIANAPLLLLGSGPWAVGLPLPTHLLCTTHP